MDKNLIELVDLKETLRSKSVIVCTSAAEEFRYLLAMQSMNPLEVNATLIPLYGQPRYSH